MALNSSGQISIGGSTVGQSINLELGRSATATSSLGETAFRTLAGVASGAISLSSFWGKSNRTFSQLGAITSMSIQKYMHAGASVGNYALFAGGFTTTSNPDKIVDAYDTSLTRTTATSLDGGGGYGLAGHAGSSVGNYALFAGGMSGNYTSYATVVITYNTSLTRSTATSLSGNGGRGIAGAKNTSYCGFAGGEYSSGRENDVSFYNSNLVRSVTYLDDVMTDMGAADFGEYMLFAGGANGSTYFSTVHAYNTSLVRSTAYLSYNASKLAGAGMKNYAIFAGGFQSGGFISSNVNAFNTSLTRTSPSGLSSTVYSPFAGGMEDYIVVGGGYFNISQGVTASARAWDKNLVATNYTLNSTRAYGASAKAGTKLIFAGGINNSGSNISLSEAFNY